jgi:hypothetical protein
MKIARLSDRFKIKMENVTVFVAPLSGKQKLEMTSFVKQSASGKFYIDKIAQEHYLVKHSVKSISGIQDIDGLDYELEFEGEALTDLCADELLGFLVNSYFTVANAQIVSGILGEVINPITGEAVKGISIERVNSLTDEEKKSP